MKTLKLKIELVPHTAWYQNLRSQFTRPQWDYIRKYTYRHANYRCEICGGVGDKHPVEAHEEWLYDEINGIIKLDRVTALCPACHTVKHIGLASITGKFEQAKAHFAKINRTTPKETENYIKEAFAVYERRSQRDWVLDIEKQKQWINKHQPYSPELQKLIEQLNECHSILLKRLSDNPVILDELNLELDSLNIEKVCAMANIPEGKFLDDAIALKYDFYQNLIKANDNELLEKLRGL